MNQSGKMIYFFGKNQNKSLYKTKSKGYTTTIAGFFEPTCVTMDSIGNIYVGDLCALGKINSTGLE